MAIFILVAIGTLAIAIARISAQSSVAAVQELVNVQAFYAAESGAQFALNQIFYVASGGAPITRAVASANCLSVAGTSLAFNADGLMNCSSSLSCGVSVDSDDLTSFFRVVSAATCGSGEVTAQRSIEVSSFIQ